MLALNGAADLEITLISIYCQKGNLFVLFDRE
jgi:hypothetical protein